jgi:hypothetical protein
VTSFLPVAFTLRALIAVGSLALSPAFCHEDSRVTMGCTATIRACGPNAAALPVVVGEALDEIDRLDRLMSRRRDSPLSPQPRGRNGPVTVGRALDFWLSARAGRESTAPSTSPWAPS